MRVAVMQPYYFPYIGYFQLIKAVDIFVFYDDVNFINKGWINRNNIMVNDQKKMISLPCEKSSQNKLINEIYLDQSNKYFNKIIKTVSLSYKNAPYFDNVYPIFEAIMRNPDKNLARFVGNSIQMVCGYLGLKTIMRYSSDEHADSKGMTKANRLIEITKREKGNQYINSLGGIELYSKEYFKSKGIDLYFLKSETSDYIQFSRKFIPSLSILDVLMFNSIQETNILLNNYDLI